MTSFEQLSLAEFSSEQVRQKIYGNGCKNVLGTYLVRFGKSNVAQFWFSKSFFYVKNQPNLSDFFFSLKNIKIGEQLSLLTYFENCNF